VLAFTSERAGTRALELPQDPSRSKEIHDRWINACAVTAVDLLAQLKRSLEAGTSV
jgi:hypothetical protein